MPSQRLQCVPSPQTQEARSGAGANLLQGYLAHKEDPPSRTLQLDNVVGHMVALGRGGVSYERGTPVSVLLHFYGSKKRLLRTMTS